MRPELVFEMQKGAVRRRVELRPLANTRRYQIFIDKDLRYMGAGFRLEECIERLSFFERSGFDVRILSRRTTELLKRFQRGNYHASAATRKLLKRGARPSTPKGPGAPVQKSLFD